MNDIIIKRIEELVTRQHIWLSSLKAQNGELTLSNAHNSLETLEKEIKDLLNSQEKTQ